MDIRYVIDVDTRGATRGIQSLQRTITRAGAALAGAFAVTSLVDLGRTAVRVGGQMEELRGAFNTLAGDVQLGGQDFNRVTALADQLGTSAGVLSETFIKLSANGIQPTNRLLTALVDASKNSTDQIGALTAAADLFSRTTEGGLNLEDLNRLIDRGIPIFAMLREELNLSKDQVTEYGKSAEGARKIQEALARQFEKRFGGTAVRELESIGSQSLILQNNINLLSLIFATEFVPAMVEATNALIDFREENGSLIADLGKLSGEAFIALINVTKLLVENLELVILAFKTLLGLRIVMFIGDVILKIKELATVFKGSSSNIEGAGKKITGVAGRLRGLIGVVGRFLGPWGLLATGIGIVANAFGLFGSDADKAGNDAKKVKEEFEKLNSALQKTPDVKIKTDWSEIDTASDYANALVDDIMGIENAANAVTPPLRANNEELLIFKTEAQEVKKTAAEIAAEAKKTADELERQLTAIDAISDGYRESYRTNLESLKFESERLALQLEMVDATDAARESKLAMLEYEQEHTARVSALVEQLRLALSAEEQNEAVIQAIRDELAEVQALYEANRGNAEAITTELANQRAELAEQVRLKAAIEDADEAIVDYTRDLSDATREAQREISRLSMSSFERELDDIEHRLNQDLQREIRAIQDLDLTPEMEKEKIEALTKATREATEAQKRAATEAYEYSRSFEYGWKTAYENYANDATNAAQNAQDIFETATKGMEDALVGFIQTGKFEWKSFVNDLVDLLLRSELQKLIAQVFGGIGGGASGGGGGILSSIGSAIGGLFGGGSGGKSGGGSGGGILSTIGSAIGGLFGGGSSSSPAGATPGFGGGGGGTLGKVVGAIGNVASDVVSAIGGFFGGLFATGGHLPAGKFGIAGESGPEFITGPANITPFTAGERPRAPTQSVTYNINAVDALSFKQLVASDPQFIHAVAAKGGQSEPFRR